MDKSKDTVFFDEAYREEFALAHAAEVLVNELLVEFNNSNMKLFDLPAHKRIFLFILTRAIKTYSSMQLLCKYGYGQDVATLLRGLLEHLITARYILNDLQEANHLAERFVAYKWIIFKRSLLDQENALKAASKEKRDEFYKHRSLVMQHVGEFKKKFNITSDRALLTWSGKTVRDMARHIDAALLIEYDLTFRQCSKFSHPTILGDQEYIIQDNKDLVFSPLPSPIGVQFNLRQAIKYFIEFAGLINAQFQLGREEAIDQLKNRVALLRVDDNRGKPHPSVAQAGAVPPIRECRVVFKVPEE